VNEYIMAGLLGVIGLTITVLLNWILRRTIDEQTRELRVLLACTVERLEEIDSHLIDLAGILTDSSSAAERTADSIQSLTRGIAPISRVTEQGEVITTGIFDGVGQADGWWEKGERLITNVIGRRIDQLAETLENRPLDKPVLSREERKAQREARKKGRTISMKDAGRAGSGEGEPEASAASND